MHVFAIEILQADAVSYPVYLIRKIMSAKKKLALELTGPVTSGSAGTCMFKEVG
jgi:hypothetical protein